MRKIFTSDGLSFWIFGREKKANFYFGINRILLRGEARAARFSAWDLPRGDNFEARLAKTLADMPLVMAAFIENEKPLALAWVREVSPLCAEAHFMSLAANPGLVLAAGEVFVETAQLEWPSLYGVIPREFYGARRLAEALGFVKIGTIRKALNVISMDKILDGIIYARFAEEEGHDPRI